MENNKIAFGKRPKNPLHRRVWKDMLRDWKRYLMICIMLVVTIGFVSGMYVANNSMLNTLDINVDAMKREDGHFLLSKKADEAALKAICSGELADVPTVYRERAYKEAADEVEKAVNDALEEKVEEQVKEAIKTQVTAAVDEQINSAKAMGAAVSDAELESMISSAYDTAIAENYDKAYREALKSAKSSEDYSKALADAIDEAKKEINKEIDDKYDELADRYGLNDKFDAVPVTVYELFYKDTNEALPSDSNYSGTIRVYGQRSDIDLYDILKGRAPQNENEILIDRMHADNANIKVGDTISVGNKDFQVVGLAAFVDYSALYESNTDTMFDALTFDIGMTTDEGFEQIRANTNANYAFTYDHKPADEYEEKTLSENFLKALITQTAVSDTEDLEIKDYVPSYANQALTFANDDIGKDKVMGEILLYILTAVLAFIFAVTISTTLEQESSVIGTLRASGYTRGELLRYYMSAPLLIVIIASVIGNALGYTVFKKIVADMYYSSYSLPGFETLWTPEAFIRTTLVPIVLMLIINLIVITKTLKLSPLRFLKHDLKQKKRKKAIRLPKWKFFQRFRIRVFMQNIPNYLMLFVGITFVMLLITMAVGMPETLSYYQDSMGDMAFAEDQIILSSTEDDDGNTITTNTDGAERFSIASLQRKSDAYNEEVAIYGIIENSRYVKLNSCDDNSVYISRAFSEKYNVNIGDTITLSEKYEHKDYKWKVYDIYDYSAGVAVFMNNEQFNRIFEKDTDDFSGYISDNKITDISKEYIAKEITSQDMMKVADQLDHSMGSYMTYFQYVCFIVAAIILYLLTKIIIEKNERSISMTKILGYENGEIASIYLVPTAVVVFFSEFLALYIGYKLMAFFWKLIMMKMSGWFAFILPASGFVKEFLLVFAAYLLITVIDFIRIRKIPKVLALKNME
ncbi:MAG: FtsX-like permease family protein [Ruminococcus sp.]|uniref:ABC transporter permease n=1 Tax=Ruminococcus sp. TaxID=41978 RepID=UPI0025D41B64|nr:ABC transporter permease [Ruminococcus sp.]MCR5601588.1 FtsX-like permease family protein [Ruminococcus sp.]